MGPWVGRSASIAADQSVQGLGEAAVLPYFRICIGVHKGPVLAGLVGVKKFAYDIWGDTMTTPSRMESSAEAGKVNISEATYALVKDEGKSSEFAVFAIPAYELRTRNWGSGERNRIHFPLHPARLGLSRPTSRGASQGQRPYGNVVHRS